MSYFKSEKKNCVFVVKKEKCQLSRQMSYFKLKWLETIPQ